MAEVVLLTIDSFLKGKLREILKIILTSFIRFSSFYLCHIVTLDDVNYPTWNLELQYWLRWIKEFFAHISYHKLFGSSNISVPCHWDIFHLISTTEISYYYFKFTFEDHGCQASPCHIAVIIRIWEIYYQVIKSKFLST